MAPITRASQAGQYMPIHHFIIWKQVLKGILNSPVKWRDNRVKVDKILSILAILYYKSLHMALDSGGPDKTGCKPGLFKN